MLAYHTDVPFNIYIIVIAALWLLKVVQDIIVQICGMLGISEQQQEEAEEFTIFYVIEAGTYNNHTPILIHTTKLKS